MSLLTLTARSVYEPVTANGNPRGADMAEAQAYHMLMEKIAMSGGFGLAYATSTGLDADLAHPAGTVATVYDDDNAAENGIYVKYGDSGAGGWTQIRTGFPGDQISIASNAGGSSANVIVAAGAPPVTYADGAQLIMLTIPNTNTSADVVVRFDGGSNLDVRTAANVKPTIGSLTAGMVVLGVVSASATQFRLLTVLDQANAATIVELARDLVLAAVATVVAPKATVALAAADDPDVDPDFYAVTYFDNNWRHNSGALYRRVASEPSHDGKFQNANNVWYEIDAARLYPQMFDGADIYNGSVNASGALSKAAAAALALGHSAIATSSGTLKLSANVEMGGIGIYGDGTVLDQSTHHVSSVGPMAGVTINGFQQEWLMAPAQIPVGELKALKAVSTTRFYVATRGPRGGTLIEFNTGNVAGDPPGSSNPTSSVNGNWDLWRQGIVRALEYSGCMVYTKGGTEGGTWVDHLINSSNISGDAVAVTDLPLEARRSQTVGNTMSYQVIADFRGFARVAFFQSGTSPDSLAIKIDGVTAKTVDLTTDSGTIQLVDVPCPPGEHVLSFTHPSGAGNLYCLGANFFYLNEDFAHVRNRLDHMAAFSYSPNYVLTRGASDYAFKGFTDDLWAGSFHGGETAASGGTTPRFAFDGQAFSMTADRFRAGRSFLIFQSTNITWPSTETLSTKSLTRVGDSAVQMDFEAIGDVVLETMHFGMSTTTTAQRSVAFPKYIGNVETQSGDIGLSNRVVQFDASLLKSTVTEITPLSVTNSPEKGGGSVDYATSAYSKYYPYYVHNAKQRVTAIRASFNHRWN